MNAFELQCPGCRKSDKLVVVGSGTGDTPDISLTSPGLFSASLFWELACERDGWGETIIDTATPPTAWIENMFQLLPLEVGDPVEVTTHPNTSYPVIFQHQGKFYEIVRVVYTYAVTEPHRPERGRTFFFVRLQDGEALLKREDGIATDGGPQSIWYMVSAQFKGAATTAPPHQSERMKVQLAVRHAINCYGLLCELEGLLRSRVLKQFGQKLEQELENTRIKGKDKDTTLLNELKRRQAEEASYRFDQTTASLLEYMNWVEWVNLIDEKWDRLFPSKPSVTSQGLKRSLRQRLDDLRVIRNAVAHMRGASAEDVQRLRDAVKLFTNLGD